MKFNFREFCKTVFFCIASINLGLSSDVVILGIVFACAFIYLFVKDIALSLRFVNKVSVPRYKKIFAYSAIVPCALWWVITPSVEMGVSPYLVYIPAWYLLYLAFLQKRSLGNGGYEVFVAFNGVAALVMGLFQPYGRMCMVSSAVALVLAAYAFGRPRVAFYKYILFVLVFVMLCCSSYVGVKYWRHHSHYNGRWSDDYYEKNRVMGFDPVVFLGSFSSNYKSRYNDEIILRVWDTLASPYLRAAVYDKYVNGHWNLSVAAKKMLYPAYYRVDYAVFESEDSATAMSHVKSVWVQSSLDNFGFLFAEPNAVGVASKNVDSLNYFSTNVFAVSNGTRSDWYYYVSDLAEKLAVLGEMDSAFLKVSEKNLELLDSVAIAMSLPVRDSVKSEADYVLQSLKTIESYFAFNFKYSLVVPSFKANSKTDPLQLFWNNKEGYCEYFATLATLLLRRQGIPARYVTGFTHPESVKGRPYVIFRRRNSHAWVETYYGHKWYIFDPTPPIAEGEFARPSWFSSKLEGLKGRFSYVLHVLKDGEWRRVVDSWQSVSERLVSGPVLYIVLALLLVAFAFVKFRKFRRNGSKSVVSKNAAQWIALLDGAEKRLARLGYVRGSGETVSAFALRIHRAFVNMPCSTKKEERQKHECSIALKLLNDYETNRWRNV